MLLSKVISRTECIQENTRRGYKAYLGKISFVAIISRQNPRRKIVLWVVTTLIDKWSDTLD